MTKQELLKKYTDSIPLWHSSSKRYRYPRVISEFIDVCGVKDKYTKDDIVRFVNNEVSRGISPSSLRWKYHVIKDFLSFIGCDMPLKYRDMPRAQQPTPPILPKDDIIKMIESVKNNGTPAMKAYLALSTTYGFRRIELARIRNSSFSDGMIQVKTGKTGIIRSHIVPDNLAPYISGYDFKERSESWFIYLFKEIQELSGISNITGSGFHSIRRSLVTELVIAGVHIPVIVKFMGWNIKSAFGSAGIVSFYFKPEQYNVDEIIFNNHPFLGYW